MSWKKFVNIHCEEKILWSWPIWQNCCQETPIEEAKQCQNPPVGQGGIKFFGQAKFEIFVSNRRIYMQRWVGERVANPCITSTVKHRGGSVMMCGGIFPIAKSEICIWYRPTSQHTATSHDSIWNTACGIKDLYSCKIMTQSYLKSKQEPHVL